MIRITIHNVADPGDEPEAGTGSIFHVSDDGNAVSDSEWHMVRDDEFSLWGTSEVSGYNDGLDFLVERAQEVAAEEAEPE